MSPNAVRSAVVPTAARLSAAFAVVAGLVLMPDPATARDTARVRFVHAGTAGTVGTPVNVTVGRTKTLFSNVAPGTVTPYQDFPEEKIDDQNVHVVPVAGGADYKSGDVAFDHDSDDYTIVAAPDKSGTGMTVKVLRVDRRTFTLGGGVINLINAVPGSSAYDLFVGNDKKHAGVNFLDVNGPDRISAGSVQVTVKEAGGRVVGAPQTINVQGGHSYTAVVMGTAPNERVVITDDRMGGAAATTGAGAAAAATGTVPAPAPTAAPVGVR